MNRRTFLKQFIGLLSIVGASGGLYYYARDIEPSMLKINKADISSNDIPPSFHNFKIIQFSDTHLGFQYTLDQLQKLCNSINQLEPDIVTFTGDLLDNPDKYHARALLSEVLQSIQAPFGKYWVYGNHDHGASGSEIVNSIMKQAEFQLLKNEHIAIEKESERIILAGIDDASLGSPNLEETFAHINHDLFSILLSHAPDYADHALKYPVDIQLSGHSHGGQVRFPFIGHLYTPAYAEKYIQGKYELGNKLNLFVSRGVGTTRLPFRFLCKPEIHLYTLKSLS